MISKQLLDHSLFLLKTLGDSLWILPKQEFATEQSVGSFFNSLSFEIRNATSTASFCCKLKAFLLS